MDSEKIRVLLVEDSSTDALLVKDELQHTKERFSVVHVEVLSEALTKLREQPFDVVLLDLSLPDSHGFETFVRLHVAAAGIPIVVLSGGADGQLAVQAVQAGAQDYLVKGHLGEDVLQRSIRYAIERQRSERTLAESEERYRLLIQRSPYAYLVYCDGKIVFVNDACMRLLGAEGTGQLLGKPYLETVSPEFHEIVTQRVRKAQDDESNPPIEVLCVRLDGSSVAVEASSNAFIHVGKPAVQVVLHDITERRRSERRFRWLVDSNAQGVMYWNSKGETTGGNDAFLRMVGYTRAEMEAGDIHWNAMTPPEYAELDRRSMGKIVATGVCAPYEKAFLRKDGSRVPILIGAATFEDNPDEGVCFMIDLTERKKVEQNALRAQRMESIGTLAGGIAHDLNNTLAPVIMSLGMLREKFTDPDSQELLAIISASAHRGADMVGQVLSFARGVEGRRMEVQVKHLLREVAKIVNDTFLKNVQVCSLIPEELWTVQGDPTQLHQVLLNLCVNARDAMPDGGTLTLSAENLTLDEQYADPGSDLEPGDGNYVLLKVKDSGTGMPAEVIEKIFDPFFTTKEIGKGTGLGLSTSLAILKSHGGSIRVSSELGKGTEFKIYLPAQTERSAAALEELEAKMPSGHGQLVLIVDDEMAIREITKLAIEAHGYRVILACDGAEALAVYARQSGEIAVVLMDMMMPTMDGPTAVQLLRRLNPAVKIIATSGLSATSNGTYASTLGVKYFLPKPYTAETVLKTLKLAVSAEAAKAA